ncbi:MAG: glycosyltransferase, partial [Clostridia bacterium]|nr:glycosyltransferase [Clostridia bacterium]
SLHHGGAETLVKDYACFMDKDKFDVIVMTTRGRSGSFNEKALDEKGIKNYYIANPYSNRNKFLKAFGALKRYRSICKVIDTEKPDVIHCHLASIKFIADIAKFKKLRCKIVFTVHSDLERQLSSKSVSKAINFLVKKHDLKIIALHREMALQLKAKFGDDNYLVLNNGTELSKYSFSESACAEYREQLGIPRDAFVVGHVGRFIELKNHKFLLKVFVEVLKKRENSRLVLIGDGELRKEIEQNARALNIGDKVIFTGLRGDIPELLNSMDAFCLPSKTEGVPVTVVEAQAAGLKCVISDVVVDDVVLTDHISKRSLDDSAEVWADDLLSPLGNVKGFNTLDSFDIKKVVERLQNYYEDVLNAKT